VLAERSAAWLGSIRSISRPIIATVTVAAAAIGFVALTHARGLGTNGAAQAFAEDVHHSVSPLSLGTVERVLVHIGQHVNAGEPLVIMDGRALELARERAMAQLAQLEAQVAAATQDEDFQVTRSELWVLKARADEQGNRAALSQISEQMDRLDGLLQKQMIPATQAEEVREKQKSLQARVGAFDQARARGQAGIGQVGAGNHDHNRAVEVHVEPFRRGIDVQKASIRQLDLQIEQLTLHAPAAGIVTTVSFHAGEVVPAGTEILSLVSNRRGVITAVLPESLALRVTPGQRVSVRSKDLFPTSYHGHVIELAPEIDEVTARARVSPNISAWGRRVTIQLDGGLDLLPGQAFNVSLD